MAASNLIVSSGDGLQPITKLVVAQKDGGGSPNKMDVTNEGAMKGPVPWRNGCYPWRIGGAPVTSTHLGSKSGFFWNSWELFMSFNKPSSRLPSWDLRVDQDPGSA